MIFEATTKVGERIFKGAYPIALMMKPPTAAGPPEKSLLITHQPEQKAEVLPEPAAKKSGLYQKLLGRSKLKQ